MKTWKKILVNFDRGEVLKYLRVFCSTLVIKKEFLYTFMFVCFHRCDLVLNVNRIHGIKCGWCFSCDFQSTRCHHWQFSSVGWSQQSCGLSVLESSSRRFFSYSFIWLAVTGTGFIYFSLSFIFVVSVSPMCSVTGQFASFFIFQLIIFWKNPAVDII